MSESGPHQAAAQFFQRACAFGEHAARRSKLLLKVFQAAFRRTCCQRATQANDFRRLGIGGRLEISGSRKQTPGTIRRQGATYNKERHEGLQHRQCGKIALLGQQDRCTEIDLLWHGLLVRSGRQNGPSQLAILCAHEQTE